MTAALPTHVSGDWLSAATTQRVLRCLADAGFQARVVGGAVRNTLLGLPVADVDVATAATPDQVIAAAAEAGLKTVPTGLAHGTVTVIADGHPIEVTTLRADVDTDGRHATVAFTGDWAADAARRDLTINALYCDADGLIFDPLGGLTDLVARRVRFIGDASTRIREDYLRILRFFRFHAQYGEGRLDGEGMRAVVAEHAGLRRLSAERVRAEFVRLLVAHGAVGVIEEMASHGILTAVLPVAPRLGAMARLVAIETATGHRREPMLRLAALCMAVTEDAQRLAGRLRLSVEEGKLLTATAAGVALAPEMSEAAARRVLYGRGAAQFERDVLLAWAGSGAAPDDGGWRHLLALPDRWMPPAMPYSGRDLIARGMKPGRRIGEILAAFERWWIDSDFTPETKLHAATLERLVAAG